MDEGRTTGANATIHSYRLCEARRVAAKGVLQPVIDALVLAQRLARAQPPVDFAVRFLTDKASNAAFHPRTAE